VELSVALPVIALIRRGGDAAVKTLQVVIPTLPLTAVRCAVAAPVLLAVARGGPFPWLDGRELGRIVALGLAGNSWFELCVTGGPTLTTHPPFGLAREPEPDLRHRPGPDAPR